MRKILSLIFITILSFSSINFVSYSSFEENYYWDEEFNKILEEKIENVYISDNFNPSWFSGENKKNINDWSWYPIYVNNRLWFQLTLPIYAIEYEAVIDESASNLIHFRQKWTEPNNYGCYGRWFSVWRMSYEEYKYFTTVESRWSFADSDVIAFSNEYIYLLQDIFVSQEPKIEKIKIEDLNFKIINSTELKLKIDKVLKLFFNKLEQKDKNTQDIVYNDFILRIEELYKKNLNENQKFILDYILEKVNEKKSNLEL